MARLTSGALSPDSAGLTASRGSTSSIASSSSHRSHSRSTTPSHRSSRLLSASEFDAVLAGNATKRVAPAPSPSFTATYTAGAAISTSPERRPSDQRRSSGTTRGGPAHPDDVAISREDDALRSRILAASQARRSSAGTTRSSTGARGSAGSGTSATSTTAAAPLPPHLAAPPGTATSAALSSGSSGPGTGALPSSSSRHSVALTGSWRSNFSLRSNNDNDSGGGAVAGESDSRRHTLIEELATPTLNTRRDAADDEQPPSAGQTSRQRASRGYETALVRQQRRRSTSVSVSSSESIYAGGVAGGAGQGTSRAAREVSTLTTPRKLHRRASSASLPRSSSGNRATTMTMAPPLPTERAAEERDEAAKELDDDDEAMFDDGGAASSTAADSFSTARAADQGVEQGGALKVSNTTELFPPPPPPSAHDTLRPSARQREPLDASSSPSPLLDMTSTVSIGNSADPRGGINSDTAANESNNNHNTVRTPTAFRDTMRKTSRFFRRLGGSGTTTAAGGASSPSSRTSVASPALGSGSSVFDPPALLPTSSAAAATFREERSSSRALPSHDALGNRPATPSKGGKSSAAAAGRSMSDVLAHSPIALAQALAREPAAAADAIAQSPPDADLSEALASAASKVAGGAADTHALTSTTQDSPSAVARRMAAVKMRRNESVGSNASAGGSPWMRRQMSLSSVRTKHSEDERLASELQTWKSTIDGVLVSGGDGSAHQLDHTAPTSAQRLDHKIDELEKDLAREGAASSLAPQVPNKTADGGEEPNELMPSIRLVSPVRQHLLDDSPRMEKAADDPRTPRRANTLPTLTTQSPTPSRSSSLPPSASANVAATPPVPAIPTPSASSRGHSPADMIRSASGVSVATSGAGRRSATPDLPSSIAALPLEQQAQQLSQRCWEEDEAFLDKLKIAEWLGSRGAVHDETLKCYMDFFDFSGLRIEAAFRRLCAKLYLKAESQQLDRILAEFGRRYWEDNSGGIWSSPQLVHSIAFSIMLLNTDLHVADVPRRMTRSEYVTNTMGAVHALDDAPESHVDIANYFYSRVGGTARPGTAASSLSSKEHLLSPTETRAGSSAASFNASDGNLTRPSSIADSGSRRPSAISINDKVKGSPVLGRGEQQSLELALRDIYDAIKHQPVLQPETARILSAPGSPSMSPYASMSRNGSRRSVTPSSLGSSQKRNSIRGFGALLAASSSDVVRSSSPTPSTATSLPDDTPSTALAAGRYYQPSVGFASNLSRTIIREQQEDDAHSDGGDSWTEEDLALLGAPWAKEGILQRKHFWESTGKRAKDKNWTQTFVVVSKGEFGMYRFGSGAGIGVSGGGLGGGNWATSASELGRFSLEHALSSAMPPPGYNRERPHCFILTLANGSSYFLQAGTADLVAEWVSTCNYWAARLSKEPLTGGVSNMEYGWGGLDAPDDTADDTVSMRSGKSTFSHRTRLSYHGARSSTGSRGASDRAPLSDWQPPMATGMHSTLSEDAQLEHLKAYVSVLRKDVSEHDRVRSPMMRMYSPRSANYNKAMANWERKSKYLLGELVKYQAYVQALSRAIDQRALKRGEKEFQRMLAAADAEEDDEPVSPSDSSNLLPATPLREAFRERAAERNLRVSTTSGNDSGDDQFETAHSLSPASIAAATTSSPP